MLNHWPVHDRQHFLGYGLGGRQESCTQAGNRKYGLADGSGYRQGSAPRGFGIGGHVRVGLADPKSGWLKTM
jgi:hypothetical protein